MGELLAGVSQSSLLAVRRRVGFGLHRNQSNSTSIICCSIRRLPKLRSSRGFGDRSDQRQQFLLAVAASGAISSDPLQASTTVTVDSIQPDTVSGGGDGDGFSNRGGGGGGGGGGGDNNNDKGEGGSDENNKKMSGMSMSQKLTLAYAALVGVGGVMGYLKSGSQKSLLAGGLSASLLYYVYTQLPTRPVIASSIGLGLSAALLGVMGSRFKKSGKIFPAGVVSLVSLIMTGGYLHGILRSLH
ncbi:protein FATTY ACID EXPORT 2, chloroplastic-like [Alnus glutinosa]|uniref:protein FATTY ACID EXPORT 2, chloroplastic-like n=1 Tax=Alnus glutinosa TaxID=3517 RepID=UPI002D79741E|nr:protein FATTY ACID EXPORT 2, chloroplastic-like [Alnus glutinosa]